MDFKNFFSQWAQSGTQSATLNTTPSTLTTGTNMFPQQFGQIVGAPWPPTPEPGPTKIEVPVFDVNSKQGIFLRDKNGGLHYVPIEKVVQIVGEEW